MIELERKIHVLQHRVHHISNLNFTLTRFSPVTAQLGRNQITHTRNTIHITYAQRNNKHDKTKDNNKVPPSRLLFSEKQILSDIPIQLH